MPNNTLAEVFHGPIRRRTIASHPLVVGTGLVGVEIELEGLRNVNFRSDYWHVKDDGSLRNYGREFVFRAPTGGIDLYNAVIELDTYLHDKDPDGNWRCSTHVHVDVRDTTVTKLKNLIIGYAVYEKILFRLSGMHRYHNNFCCPLGFAQNQLEVLARAWNQTTMHGFVSAISRRWDKYSALNLATLTSFGSVEFRMAEPTWRKGKLLLLCNRLLALKQFTDGWQGSPEELITTLVTSNPRAILGRGCPKELPPQIQEDLETGMKLAFDILAFAQVPLPLVLNKGWPARDVDFYRNFGNLPQGLQRVPLEILADGSPRVNGPLSDGVRNWLMDQARANFQWHVPRQLLSRLNFTFIDIVSEGTGIGPRTIFGDDNAAAEFTSWKDAGKPLQPLPEEQPPQEEIFFEPEPEEDDDELDEEW